MIENNKLKKILNGNKTNEILYVLIIEGAIFNTSFIGIIKILI